MAVQTKYLNMIAGSPAYVEDPALTFARVLKVVRENGHYNASGGGAPSTSEFLHSQPLGRITFAFAVEGDGSSDIQTERVKVILR